MMRGRLHLLAAPASSAGTQMTLSCTYDSRHILHYGNRILWHHTPQSMCTVSVSLPPVPLPENSSVAVAHSPTCQKSLVFLLSLQIARQHRQTQFAPPFADSLHTNLTPLPSTRLCSCCPLRGSRSKLIFIIVFKQHFGAVLTSLKKTTQK
ncbi:hypothetical protein TcCL_ESM09021 [Trypanosoma cruzi]|nr:hypothetical protein TcCL_ESM09021 [Trypanosoma cruzi]